jgi:hypothetical protein
MRNTCLIFVKLTFCCYLLTGCNSNSSIKTRETTDFMQLVLDWDDAHSSKDVGVFSGLFDNTVLFYGTQQDKNSCIENKLSLFKKHPDFNQEVYGEIQIENISDTEVKCSFVKKVTVNQATTDYPSYLVFKKSGDSWKIITEGDLFTDKNLAKKELTKTEHIKQQDYFYEPAVSVISGIIKIESFSGPQEDPENPQNDSREDCYILNLDNSINVISKIEKIEEDNFNGTKYNISKIQLVSDFDIKLTNYKNKHVRLTGTFFGAHTGHHHTDVLMHVTKAEEE